MDPFRNEVAVYRLFSAVVTQDVIVEGVAVALGLRSKKKNPQGAKLLTTDLLCGFRSCALGLLREKARLDVVEKVALSNEDRRGLDLDANMLAGSQNWDHSLCFMCEDIISVS